MKRKPLIDKDGEVRELTRADIRAMRPAREIVPHIVAAYERGEMSLRGRPVGRSKNVVSVSLDKEVVAALRKSGSGWQTRLNNLAKAALGLIQAEK
jgi:uncharacterized protein (DUF4415 family)